MSELDGSAQRGGPDGWLTDVAAAIAGFTTAVLSLLANGAWAVAIQAFLTRNGTSSLQDVVIATGVAQGLLAIVALVLARRAVDSSVVTARNLGGAAVIVGVLGLAAAVVTVVVGFVGVT